MKPNSTIWVGDAADPTDGTPVLEGEVVATSIEVTDVDEIAVHATLVGDSNAVASLYFTCAEAALLAARLSAAAAGQEQNSEGGSR